MKTYIEFINESVSKIRLKKEFNKLFPNKDIFEQYIIDEANEIYSNDNYVADDIEDVDEGTYLYVIESKLIWKILTKIGIDEIPAHEKIKFNQNLLNLINEFY